jgi:pseudaminic acid biosynthesis-associated methylase
MTARRETPAAPTPDARAGARLEALWRGSFGREYTDRNAAAGSGRERFWAELLAAHPVASVLEVGSNVGANLRWIAPRVGTGRVVGVDLNEYALSQLRVTAPDSHGVVATSRQLPFRTGAFDLVFTAGVLIHHAPDTLGDVLVEIVRCARRYVLCLEYFADGVVEVPYRGQRNALFKQDFGACYRQACPGLRLLSTGHLAKDEGWDNVTVWLFGKDAR